MNYGFVEYDDPGAAERAMQTLNGRRIHQSVSNEVDYQLYEMRLIVLGNPCKLGLPVQQHPQRGYVESFPHLCRRFEQ